MRETSVYRTASGTIFRVSQGGDEYLAVETLTGSDWVKSSTGIVGLRVAPDTVRLTAKQHPGAPS